MVILVEDGPLVICLWEGGELIGISGENLKERSEYMSKEPEKQGKREARRVMKERKLKIWQEGGSEKFSAVGNGSEVPGRMMSETKVALCSVLK